MNVEEMPRYFENNWEIPGFWQLLAEWFEDRGFEVCASFVEFGLESPAGRPVIALGRSPRGNHGHACIYRDGVLAHDPHESGDGTLYPHTYLWFEPTRKNCFQGGETLIAAG